ncbi:MAG: C4-dicarboxylate ABC transporter permease [Alphaproteobacteria bacterium]|nr:MAG: C4-dicarboxylate ABC transporter permease [Alphaproteobacteria bacterium]
MDAIRRAGAWLYRRAENVLALMLAAMFVAFLLQILFRYVLNLPIGWTSEASSILWIWLVLFGASFVLREDEEIRFDLFHASAGRRARRVLTLVTAAVLICLYGVSLPAVVDYVTFMKVERSSYLKIRFDWLFSIYVVFVVVTIIRYIWLGWTALKRAAPEETGLHGPEPGK